MANKKLTEASDILACVEEAARLTLGWAAENEISPLRIEPVTPAILTHKTFSVWLFFDTDSRMNEYEANGTVQKIKDKYSASLKELNCDEEYIRGIIFFTDTDENIKRFASLEPIKVG